MMPEIEGILIVMVVMIAVAIVHGALAHHENRTRDDFSSPE